MKLGLGTVQFGLNYGISNQLGQVSFEKIREILHQAINYDIDTLDTAQGYGESEKVLGKFDLSPFKIISKMSISSNIHISLNNLNVNSLYALLFHNENEISKETFKKFELYKEKGLTNKIGVSVYFPEKLNKIIDNYPIDLVQLPCNLFDQRFLPLFSKLKYKNIEIHARSIFLQGLLLMEHSNIPNYFLPIIHILESLPKNKLAACLSFVKEIKEIDKIIIGVTSANELKEIIKNYHIKIAADFKKFSIQDENFILPTNWK